MPTDDDSFEGLFSHLAYFGSAVLVAYAAAALTSHPVDARRAPPMAVERPVIVAPADMPVCVVEAGVEGLALTPEGVSTACQAGPRPPAAQPAVVVSLQD